MPDLGPYAAEVLSAYAVALALLGWIVGLSLWQARRARARLSELEGRRPRGRRAGRSAPAAPGEAEGAQAPQ